MKFIKRKKKAPRPKSVPSLGTVKLDDELMTVDFQLMDKFQGFSAELVRVPLLGIAVFGFLLKDVFLVKDSSPAVVITSGLAVIFFALSGAAALYHRYLSTDSMACHIRYLRIIELLEPKEGKEEEVKEEKAEAKEAKAAQLDDKGKKWLTDEQRDEQQEWHGSLKRSGKCLKYSAILLALGGMSLATAFVILLASKLCVRC